MVKLYFPKVLETECFNENNLPFSKEILETEMGHLFEHILLEYLCEEKIECGAKRAVFSGRTDWDWYQHPYGTFEIRVNAGTKDEIFFDAALTKSISLFEKILHAHTKNQQTKSPGSMRGFYAGVNT
jgi:hypothetical protein